MAINAFEKCEKHQAANRTPGACKAVLSGWLGKAAPVHVELDDSVKRAKLKKRSKNSPYLHNDKIQLLSQITETKLFHRRDELFSSFPLATKIYKASSDEFKALKKKQKPKKSVLTLPNVPAPIPKTSTVSDVNDSDYRQPTTKKRLQYPNRKATNRTKGFEFFDRDAHLDVSSTDILNTNYDGDGRKVKHKRKPTEQEDLSGHDVWAVIRNINKLPFKVSSEPTSQEVLLPKKKMSSKKTNFRKGRRLIETHRTQEFSYVANFEISESSPSPTSSFDRVTVINKKDAQNSAWHHKNQIMSKTANRPRNFYKALPRQFPKAIQMKDNRLPCKNKIGNIHKVPCSVGLNKNVKSIDTLKGSFDSGNFSRATECDSSISNSNIKVKSPHPYKTSKPLLDKGSTDLIIKGIARILKTCPRATMPNKYDAQKPKSVMVTTMPCVTNFQKITPVDAKRRLAQIKYPLVILGKDQISSNFEVPDYEHPQFNGLNERMWPFMVEWTKHNNVRKEKPIQTSNQNAELPISRISNNLKEINDSLNIRIAAEKFCANTPNKKLENKRPLLAEEGNAVQATQRKPKPIRQLRDKMIKLLYKKPFVEEIEHEQGLKFVKNTVNTLHSTNTDIKSLADTDIVPRNVPKRHIMFGFKRLNNPKYSTEKHSWASAKWTSDFIDNVMSKIKSGVYYNGFISQDVKLNKNTNNIPAVCSCVGKSILDLKDVSIQTINIKECNSILDFEHNFTQSSLPPIEIKHDKESVVTIPGFDGVLPEIEIKTLNINQVAVRHCLTNVMVHFDVTKTNSSKMDSIFDTKSCVPMFATEDQSKVFKCKTRILNAVLPAELCSVVPKLMQNMFDNETTLLNTNLFKESLVSISELKESDSLKTVNLHCGFNSAHEQSNPFNKLLLSVQPRMNPNSCNTPQGCKLPFQQWSLDNPWTASWFTANNNSASLFRACLSPELQKLLLGSYSTVVNYKQSLSKEIATLRVKCLRSEITILPQLSNILEINIILNPTLMRCKPAESCHVDSVSRESTILETQFSTALQPYEGGNTLQIVDNVGVGTGVVFRTWMLHVPREFTHLLQSTWQFCKFNIHLNMPLNYNPPEQNFINTVNILKNDSNTLVSITQTNFKIGSLYKGFANNASPLKCIECDQNGRRDRNIQGTVKKSPSKVRKSGYAKMYKKCYSTSSLSGDKTTKLNKITNSDDFIQALGAGRVLSNVLDGCVAKKVLGCLEQMKNWVTEITRQQALLILLLANKKDTTNLVKFRPIILQGIAVNRITRATELDMEIEVIETENLKLRQFDGISYLPASIANKDSLMEELCWIAKTTASDYQRPFDESSEVLLKSLIEKRKKLNPSYLRVMARYVGLGLLKSPIKN